VPTPSRTEEVRWRRKAPPPARGGGGGEEEEEKAEEEDDERGFFFSRVEYSRRVGTHTCDGSGLHIDRR